MSKNSLPCPECGHENAAPAAGTKKITCGGCGMIIVLAKIYGEDWASRFAPAAAAAPSRPKISSRRDRQKAPAEEPPAEPAREGRRAARASRSTKGQAPHSTKGGPHGGHGHHGHHGHHDHHGHHGEHHYRNPNSMPPGLLWGSIAGIIIVGLLVGMVIKHNSDQAEKDRLAEQAKMEARNNPAPRVDGDGLTIPSMDGQDDGLEIPKPPAGDEKPAAATTAETTKKPEKPKRESTTSKNLDPFPVDSIPAEIKTEVEAAIAVLKDLDATTEIRGADNKLFAHRKEAIPMLLNALFELKLDDPDDVKRGWSLVQSLGRCSEHRTDWEMEFNVMTWPEDEEAVQKAARNRTIMLKMWHKWWADNGEGWEPPKEDEGFFDD